MPSPARDLKAERKAWNVPDWRNPEEYNYVKNLTREQLRWEFLRRDKQYRALSKRSSKLKTHFLLGKFIKPNIRGDKLPKDFSFADSIRRGEGLALNPPSIQSLLFKKGSPDPQAPQGSIDAYYGAQIKQLWEENFIVIAFNPFRPIEPQIITARNRLKETKRNIAKQAPELLGSAGGKSTIKLKDAAKLLRVIDAHNEGLSDKDIGIQIYKISPEDYSDARSTGFQHLKRARTYWKTL